MRVGTGTEFGRRLELGQRLGLECGLVAELIGLVERHMISLSKVATLSKNL